jgi:hypothetical protein
MIYRSLLAETSTPKYRRLLERSRLFSSKNRAANPSAAKLSHDTPCTPKQLRAIAITNCCKTLAIIAIAASILKPPPLNVFRHRSFTIQEMR